MAKTSGNEGRLYRGGTPTIVAIGHKRELFGDLYHYLVNTSWPRFGALVLGWYLGLNCLFATIYLALGASIENARESSFVDAFFFSVQTMATIGYGKMVPQGLAANAVVAIEALAGMLGVALATSLMFSKFSRPTARVLFSNVACVSSRDGVQSLQFRMANQRGNQIVEANLRAILLRNEKTLEGEPVRKQHDIKLVRSNSVSFALSWTAIHVIDKDSPLFGMTPEQMEATEAEVVVSLVGIDDTTNQTVHARWSWMVHEMRFGERFVDILERRPNGGRVIDFARFHDTMPLAAAKAAEKQ